MSQAIQEFGAKYSAPKVTSILSGGQESGESGTFIEWSAQQGEGGFSSVCFRQIGKIVFTMQTRVSTKGQVVLPGPIRRRLDIRPGDPLEVNIEDGRIVLAPRRKRAHRVKLTTDPVTGLPVLSAGPDAPTLSSREVEEILSNFP